MKVRKGQWLIVGALMVILVLSSLLTVPRVGRRTSFLTISTSREAFRTFLDQSLVAMLADKQTDGYAVVSFYDEVASLLKDRGENVSVFVFKVERNGTGYDLLFFNGNENTTNFYLDVNGNIIFASHLLPWDMKQEKVNYSITLPANLTFRVYNVDVDMCFRAEMETEYYGGIVVVATDLEGNTMIITTRTLTPC